MIPMSLFISNCWRFNTIGLFSRRLYGRKGNNDDGMEDPEHQMEVSDITQLVPCKEVAVKIDEIMQQETSPLCAVDIEEVIKKQFAYLSGGRGEDGCPIITFPEYPSFGEIQEKEIHDVLTYLTSIPSLQAAGVGFILIIDRRQDKWASVKGTLLRIAGSFPGNLQLILVLRPTGLFQRALSDFVFRFNKDEFKMKVPIIMLSSVTELHSYIDRTQLTQELGGTLEYSHDEWLSHRTAIEGFALMVKKTAQMLQSFGTELAETELPNDVQATTSLLEVHTEKKEKMKEDLRRALNQGHGLFESINEPIRKDPGYTLNQDELENLATVERLLGQLNETETAFDEFWDKHQSKLEQCLQLRHFEQNFREIKVQLNLVTERLAAFTDPGNCTTHVEHILQDLSSHEEKTCEVLDQAKDLASEGDQLIQNNHYAVDSILPKCNELRRVTEDLASEMQLRKAFLHRCLELHQMLEKAAQWCDEGIYLLASQPVDKCQSQDGAQSALQEIERFLEAAADNKLHDLDTITSDYETILNQEFSEHVQKVLQKQEGMQEMFEKRRVSLKKLAAKQTRPVQPVAPRPEAFSKSPHSSPGPRRGSGNTFSPDKDTLRRLNYRKGECNESRTESVSEEEENLAVLRRHVMNELLETERAYVEELLCVLEGYAAEMDNPVMMHLIPVALQNKKEILFGNMTEIYQFHNRIFLRELENYIHYPELVGRCFLERMKDLQIYEKYCHNKPRSESLWRQCSDCVFFQECQKKLEHKLGLDSYLLKPVQRITKYQLLLKELLKYSKNCDGSEDLQEALTAILGILKAVNDSMHLIAITGYDGNLNDLGKLLMQGSFNVWTVHKKGHSKVKDLARFKPMQRHLFLHQKALLFCKKREENGEGYEKAPSYSFKHYLNMSAVGITENAKGDYKKFEIWCNAREEVYIVQAPTPEIKTAWVNEIRKVLTGQLNAYREASQQKSSEQVFQSPGASTPVSSSSPFKSYQKNNKKSDERKSEPASPDSCFGSAASPKYPEKVRDEATTSPTSERSAVSKKRFTLQGFSNLKNQKGSPTSPDNKAKRHEIKSDPAPFGFRVWGKASQSFDASEENDGYSSAEDPLNSSDAEEEATGKKLSPGKYTVVAEYDKGNTDDLTVKSGEMVQLIREGEDGQWYVKNLNTSKEGWVSATNLLTMIGDSKSSLSLCSSESGTGSSNLSTSSSCSESCTASNTSISNIKG
ncbi:guanine nucleotide exchange factor DBS-like isoform X4 [Acipenser ruthenus]|uniref:guanine nucleotide exchange factor DBS-like isoform X4 n=1 Tax=Acipenser ruthenus TaxID=7906 RepID=UPI0027412E82|nr:guanine nucleotide exchange factor DBS-like isoform X4 [Acipenser ruthenus]